MTTYFEIVQHGITVLETVGYHDATGEMNMHEIRADIRHSLVDHSGYYSSIDIRPLPADTKFPANEIMRYLPTLTCLSKCEGRDRRYRR